MSSGALYQSKCYSSQSDAVDAFYGAGAPALTASPSSTVAYFINENGAWVLKNFFVSETGVLSLRYSSLAPIPTFPECSPYEHFADGIYVGWGIAAAMISAAAYKHMRVAAK